MKNQKLGIQGSGGSNDVGTLKSAFQIKDENGNWVEYEGTHQLKTLRTLRKSK